MQGLSILQELWSRQGGGSAGHLHILGGDDVVKLAHFADEIERASGKAVHDGVRVSAPAVGQSVCAA